MKECCMIEIAFSIEEEANKTIEILLNNKLASSCQKILSESTWNWKQKREMSKEYILKITTITNNVKKYMKK